jgi:putative membrane protein
MGSHCWWWGPGYFFGSPWSVLLGLVFWGLVVVALVRVVAYLTGPRGSERSRPLDILKERYAKGEMDREEFERRRRDLEA